MSESHMTMQYPAPDGDIEFMFGSPDKSKILRVSSAVLILASPVFKALLGHNFEEGNRTISDEGKLQISLPDDDIDAMVWVLQALHYRHDVPYDISSPMLEQIAGLCDKYDLAGALRGRSELCIQYARQRLSKSKSIMDFAMMAGISLMLESHIGFHTNTLSMLIHTPSKYPTEKLLDSYPKTIPQRLFSECD